MFGLKGVIDHQRQFCKERTSGRLFKMLEIAGQIQSSIMTGSLTGLSFHIYSTSLNTGKYLC